MKALNATDQKKQALEADICALRQLYKIQLNRRGDLIARKSHLLNKNGGSSIQASDIIHLNVGGTKIRILRETLTLIKGSRLEVLFSGRWENKLLRDDDGCVFMDLDAFYFKKIVEYLISLKVYRERKGLSSTIDGEQVELPQFSDSSDQAVFDVYMDFFRLRDGDARKGRALEEKKDDVSKKMHANNQQYDDLVDTFKAEKNELSKLEKQLDDLEKKLDAEESFVSFFTGNNQGNGVPDDASEFDDGISFTSMSSDLDSHQGFSVLAKAANLLANRTDSGKVTGGKQYGKKEIIQLWLDGDIIPVKLSTMCCIKDSPNRFKSESWVEEHSFQCDDGSQAILMEYPSEAFKKIINQLRLITMAQSTSIAIPLIRASGNLKKELKMIVTAWFEGEEHHFLNMQPELVESSILQTNPLWEKQIEDWLSDGCDMSKNEPTLLYRATEHGWSTSDFHSKGDNQGPTLTIVKTNQGYVFGGYNDQSWPNPGDYGSFLFSLNSSHGGQAALKMKFVCNYSNHIGNYGPSFGNDLIVASSSSNLKFGTTCIGHAYGVPSGYCNAYYLTGQRNFTAVEVEVYKV